MTDDLYVNLVRQLPFTPGKDQRRALEVMARFAESKVEGAALILRGYAGTGKTSLVSAMVRALTDIGRETVLLAPTGRAAKVFSHYSGAKAYTIHKVIYRQKAFNGEDTKFSLDFNKRRNAIFIVDEASMISQQDGGSIFGSGRLLDDLIQYVYAGYGCKMLLVGDTAQLPPVGDFESPALSPEVLDTYGLRAYAVELKEVMRQDKSSGVLANATDLRNHIAAGEDGLIPKVDSKGYDDLRFVNGAELMDTIESCYDDAGEDETIVITRSNKRAEEYNMGVRAMIYGREEQISVGDRIMVVKNNYYWTEKAAATNPSRHAAETDFIANGDVAVVERIGEFSEMAGFHFVDADITFPDYGDMSLHVRLLLDTLTSGSPSLSREDSLRLYEACMDRYANLRTKRSRLRRLREDPFYNAMQIKYAYAVTCHKAQGGQWSRVFLDQGFITPDMADINYLRWLYTAFTRTTERLYLISWPMSQRMEQSDWD
jgi:exodeoxyribonuclease-5